MVSKLFDCHRFFNIDIAGAPLAADCIGLGLAHMALAHMALAYMALAHMVLSSIKSRKVTRKAVFQQLQTEVFWTSRVKPLRRPFKERCPPLYRSSGNVYS